MALKTDKPPQAVEQTGASIFERLTPHILIILAFSVAVIAATWPLFPQLGGFVVTRDDPVQAIWEMAWQAHALATNPLNLLQANINYPFQSTLAFNEISFTEAVLAAPLYWLTGNPVFSHNAVILLAYIVGAYGVWLLARELTGNDWAGLVAGSAFAFSFWMINNLQHTTPVSAEWLPFALLAAYKLMWSSSWRWTFALALFFALNALSSHYLAFYGAILLGLFCIYYVIAQKSLFTWKLIGRFAVGLGVGGAQALPIAIPYAVVQGSYNFGRDIFQVERFSNALVSFLAVNRANPLYHALLAPFADQGPWPVERSAFPGLVAPLLAVIALVWTYRRRIRTSPSQPATTPGSLWLHTLFYTMVGLVTAALSLGPSLQINFGNVYDPNSVKGVLPLPYLLLYEYVPAFASMRVATRIGVLTALALALLSGIGAYALFSWLRPRLAGRKSARRALPALALVLALLPLLETWSAPFPLYPIATRAAVPAVYRWLGEQPPTVILEYPMALKETGPDNVAMQNLIQYYSVYHWQKMVNGSVTIRPYAYTAFSHETDDCFPCPRSVDALWLLGVKYVVAHLDYMTAAQREEFSWRSTSPVGKVLDYFKLVQDFGADKVYQIVGPPEVDDLAGRIPAGASILLGAPEADPIKVQGEEADSAVIGGGYMAALGWYFRDHPLYGDPKLTFGETIKAPDPNSPPDYALLWLQQDPASEGYPAQNRIWSNEFVALYKR